MAINQSEDSSLLDPKLSPLLLFDYDDYEPQGDNLDNDHESIADEPEDQEHHNSSLGTEKSHRNDEIEQESGTFFFYSMTKRLLICKRLDCLKDHIYRTTPQGWMLMVHPDSHDTFLWNPFTGHRINLPLDEDDFLVNNHVRCLLSHRPADPNCVVLVVDCRDTILWYCHPGGNQWFMHMYDELTRGLIPSATVESMTGLTAVGGKFYARLCDRVITLEFLPNPTFTTSTIAFEEASTTGYNYSCSNYALLESCGELFCLFFKHPTICDHKVVQIQVHKLDLSARTWLKVHMLGDRVFIVDSCYLGTSLGAKEVGLKGNCIYFVMSQDKGLYVYDMERGTTAIHNPGQNLPDDIAAEIVIPPS
jgi:hypothetical protein